MAAVHAGWRGTAGGIVSRTLEQMSWNWRCEGQDLIALIGPGIGSCCYQVGADVYESFVKTQPSGESWFVSEDKAAAQSGPRWRLDLLSANRAQLAAGGVQPQKIFHLGDCTACCSGLYFSYRRDGAATGRMLSVIGIADSNGNGDLAWILSMPVANCPQAAEISSPRGRRTKTESHVAPGSPENRL